MKQVLDATPPALRRFAKFVAASTLFLIFAGAMVTSTGSGLAVPDWPLSYGMLMPRMVAGIFFEHGHRMIAATVGLLTVIQAIWLQLREPKRFVRILGWCAAGAVVAQGLLGGLTVILLLPPAVSVAHAGLAEIFFSLNVSIAFFTSRFFLDLRELERGDAPVTFSGVLVVLVYLQILAGALMRHLGAGLAIPDFPWSFGRLVPPFTSLPVAVNFAHRVGALVIVIAVGAMLARLRRFESGHPLRQLANFLPLLLAMQIFLGAEVVWSGAGSDYHSLVGQAAMRHAILTSFHVAVGASTLAASLLLALTARTVGWRRVRHIAPVLVSEVAA